MALFAHIQFIKHLPNAIVPDIQTSGSACFDFHAARLTFDEANQCLMVDTGLRTAFSEQFAMMLYGRSGNAVKHGIRLPHGVAVIDSDYRGPLMIPLVSDRLTLPQMAEVIKVGDRIAQGFMHQKIQSHWFEAHELPASGRGEGGFGSTGTQ